MNIVSGTLRRNVLGAIALKRTIATSRSEATTTEAEPDNERTASAQEPPRPTNPQRAQRTPGATATEQPGGEPFPLDILFQE